MANPLRKFHTITPDELDNIRIAPIRPVADLISIQGKLIEDKRALLKWLTALLESHHITSPGRLEAFKQAREGRYKVVKELERLTGEEIE